MESDELGAGDRVAWPDGPSREAGEGVIQELLPGTAADTRPRCRISVFRDGNPTGDVIELPTALVWRVPRWRGGMAPDERRLYHGGSAAEWDEPPAA